jgi:hypothetical protein
VITNALTKEEFERMLKPILRLEPTGRIFDTIYPLFHLPVGKRPYGTDGKDRGIATTYRSFTLDIKYINWAEFDSSEHPRLILSFTKTKTSWDDWVNPTHKIVNDLKKLSMSEIPGLQFEVLPTAGVGHEQLRILYQKGTYNPDWVKQHRVSPLTIFRTIAKEKGQEYYAIEYWLVAECFERKDNKTMLKGNWKDLFRFSAPLWF